MVRFVSKNKTAKYLVGDHDHGLVSKHPADAVLEDVLADVSIHGREHIIQEIHVRLRVHRAGQGHPLLLPT